MDPELFPVLPAELASLSPDELEQLREQYRVAGRAVRDGDADTGELSADQVLEQMKAASANVKLIEAELATRTEGEQEFARQADEALAEMGVTDEAASDTDGEEADESDDEPAANAEQTVETTVTHETTVTQETVEPAAETVAETQPELIVASAQPRIPVRTRRFDHLPAGETDRAVLRASGGIEGVREGAALDRIGLGEAMVAKLRRLPHHGHTKDGTLEQFSVARIEFPFPEERRLEPGDGEGNTEKVRAIGSPWLGREAYERLMAPNVLTASGGLCAPLEPIYAVPSIGTADRPVRDALPSFTTARGGVSVPTPFTAADMSTGISVIEESNDAQGGTFATKSCLALNCPAFTDVAVGAISHCIEHGNFNARAWPEGVAQINDALLVEHSRIAEGRLLDKIDALSLAVTQAAIYGASATLLWALQLSRAGIISRLRLDPNTRFRVILPFWGAPMFSQDLVNGDFARFDTPPAMVSALLSRFGFDVIWHLDQGVAGGATQEIFSTEVASSSLDDWLGTTMIARVFPEGTFLHLDGGTLDFGVTRDSTLNSTNDYNQFAEIFENVARVGPAQAAERIAITICPSGSRAALGTLITCS